MKKMKRIFAALLCLCMMASVLPMGAAATGADSVSVAFKDATHIASGDTSDVEFKLINSANYTTIFYQVGAYENEWAAFKLGSELNAGYYDGAFVGVTLSTGGKYDIYLVPETDSPAEVENALQAMEPIRTVNFSGSKVEDYAFPFTTKIPNDGKYMIVAKAIDDNDGTREIVYGFVTKLNMQKIGSVADFSNKASVDFTDGNITSLKSGSAGTLYNVEDSIDTPDVDERHIYFMLYSGVYQFHAFDIGFIKDGDYKGTIKYAKCADSGNYIGGVFDIYLIPVSETNPEKDANEIIYALNPDAKQGKWMDADAVKIATVDCSDNGGSGYWQNCDFVANDLMAGKYYLVATQATSDGKYVRLQGFDMVPADFEYATVDSSAQVTGSDVLGENYAYIRKDGTDWVVNFFGGVKKTDGYSKVGFEVVYNNGTTVTQESDKVYTDFRVGGQQIAAQNFGADVQWIFGGEFALNDIDTTQPIKFRAYAVAVDEEGNETTVYGKTYTATIE